MATKKYKPSSPGMRSRSVVDKKGLITTKNRIKRLTTKLSSNSGRNNTGKITVRRQGGGNKRIYRFIDFKRNKYDVPGILKSVEYDPFRNAYIGLVNYVDGDKRYIILPAKLSVGTEIISGSNVEISVGNCMPLKLIPEGSIIHNIEHVPGKGAQFVRSAGASAVLQSKSKKYAAIKLPSGEVRLFLLECTAVIGEVSNSEFRNTTIGKAGAKRWKGVRPSVRGAAMNPCDHPHGGGEGKAPVGLSGPKSKWGKPTLGYKTRKRKSSDRLRIRKRK